jgi:hypothetical protein
MHPLLAKLTGTSAIENLRQQIISAKKEIENMWTASARIKGAAYQATIAANNFRADPTELNAVKWLEAKALAAVAQDVLNEIVGTVLPTITAQVYESPAMKDKIREAVDEVAKEFRSQIAALYVEENILRERFGLEGPAREPEPMMEGDNFRPFRSNTISPPTRGIVLPPEKETDDRFEIARREIRKRLGMLDHALARLPHSSEQAIGILKQATGDDL